MISSSKNNTSIFSTNVSLPFFQLHNSTNISNTILFKPISLKGDWYFPSLFVSHHLSSLHIFSCFSSGFLFCSRASSLSPCHGSSVSNRLFKFLLISPHLSTLLLSLIICLGLSSPYLISPRLSGLLLSFWIYLCIPASHHASPVSRRLSGFLFVSPRVFTFLLSLISCLGFS